MVEFYQKRYISEYLPLMKQRPKWVAKRRNLIPGDAVLVADTTAPEGPWMMVKVLDIRSDVNGLVHSVRFQMNTIYSLIG